MLKKKLLNKKLKQDKVVRKLLVVLRAVIVKAEVEANLLKDVGWKALIEADLWEDVVDKAVVNKLCLKAVLLQALEDLSQALSAKLKLCKVEADKALLLKALLLVVMQGGLAKLKLVKVEAVLKGLVGQACWPS